MPARSLVVFYSTTGATRRVGLAVAHALGADVEEIRSPISRSGFFGFMRSGMEASLGLKTLIEPPSKRASDYSLVVIGTPIWAFTLSSPVRTYLNRNPLGDAKIAYFCTSGSGKSMKAFAALNKFLRRDSLATMTVKNDAAPVPNKEWVSVEPKLEEFDARVKSFVADLDRAQGSDGRTKN